MGEATNYDIAMPKATKSRKIPGFARNVVADNVKALMNHHYAGDANKPKRLAGASGVALATIQRVMKADNGPSVDTVEAIASAFGLACYQLLIPGIDPTAPDEIAASHERERRMFAASRRKAPA